MTPQRYLVVVTWEDGKWLAEVPHLPGTQTYAENLVALDASVREAIAAMEDLPEGAEPTLRLHYELVGEAGSSERLSEELVSQHRRIQAEQETLFRQIGASATLLLRRGLTLAEVADALGLNQSFVSRGLEAYREASGAAGSGEDVRPRRRGSGAA